ncbi:hypothetical protein CDAR_477581 [Caerostris darwini]|uniref:Uncharacterized protein n=1 Tax=Caerostris darwini TaxID=1538125 RepID=A0AAV4RPJ2_9ARAC|nr:hypothetical protein CDAR_477581 [Caerostris darwini]
MKPATGGKGKSRENSSLGLHNRSPYSQADEKRTSRIPISGTCDAVTMATGISISGIGSMTQERKSPLRKKTTKCCTTNEELLKKTSERCRKHRPQRNLYDSLRKIKK